MRTNFLSWRRHHGLSQAQVGALADPPIDDSAICRFENETRTGYPVAFLTRLADAVRRARPKDPMTTDQLLDRASWEPPPVIPDACELAAAPGCAASP